MWKPRAQLGRQTGEPRQPRGAGDFGAAKENDVAVLVRLDEAVGYVGPISKGVHAFACCRSLRGACAQLGMGRIQAAPVVKLVASSGVGWDAPIALKCSARVALHFPTISSVCVTIADFTTGGQARAAQREPSAVAARTWREPIDLSVLRGLKWPTKLVSSPHVGWHGGRCRSNATRRPIHA